MSRASDAAMKEYPVEMIPLVYQDLIDSFGGKTEIDTNAYLRATFQFGYEQAEEDFISLIEFRIGEILGDAQPAPVLRAELRELVNKIGEK